MRLHRYTPIIVYRWYLCYATLTRQVLGSFQSLSYCYTIYAYQCLDNSGQGLCIQSFLQACTYSSYNNCANIFSHLCVAILPHKDTMKTVNSVSIIEQQHNLLSTYHTRPANGKQTHNTKLTSTNITIIPPMAVRDHRGTWKNVLLQVVSTSLNSVIFLIVAAG